MKIINIIILLLSFTCYSCEAKIKNPKTETHKIYGNCEMCKVRIEKAAYEKSLAKAVWDENTKIATLTFNSKKTNTDEILKRIAYAGYDNEKYIAPDEAYAKLPGCCQYERKSSTTKAIVKSDTKMAMDDTTKQTVIDTIVKATAPANPIAEVYDAYFALKDALTKDDGVAASNKAKILYDAIYKLPMEKLTAAQHIVWMKYEKLLSYDAEHIKGVEKVDHQREHFIALSKNMYEVMKVIKMDTTVYYDFCPMADGGKGATWLSLQKPIVNPYFGKQMLTCGKVQATIIK
ncbi:MAG: DUF3347 domain-containing protein [Bacteroidota bacterium]|nr:DUF3347 domain-containing protein [Bacteroidota bacterium]